MIDAVPDPKGTRGSGAGAEHVPPAARLGEKLDWDAFSARYFPGRHRHDLDAVAAYGAYKQGRDWARSASTAPPRLSLVPDEPVPPAAEAQSEGKAVHRLLLAVAAEQVWEGEGGFAP